ncbi:Major facilitator superfamily domain, general substrate transporter [Penicillium italicum]|uniref:Major facilitator superfamily domain, general substrate transporter n=1 Tax=Penicillium italicum TaxID=40296 RepID=A0A0A2KMR1_PENIT|nr:Major facilitator superfamily domain, general substrate transporter [Penicillium italicum]
MNKENHPDLQRGGTKNPNLQELSSWADHFRKGCWHCAHIGIGLRFFQQFIDINALIEYSPNLFATMGLGTSMQLILSGVLNVVQLVGVTVSTWTMDVDGRRKSLLGGAALMAISHIIIAALVGIYSVDWSSHKAEGWNSLAFLLFHMLAFESTWGHIPWAMPSEIFPSSLRANGVALQLAPTVPKTSSLVSSPRLSSKTPATVLTVSIQRGAQIWLFHLTTEKPFCARELEW